jgi:hypothetical protein
VVSETGLATIISRMDGARRDEFLLDHSRQACRASQPSSGMNTEREWEIGREMGR